MLFKIKHYFNLIYFLMIFLKTFSTYILQLKDGYGVWRDTRDRIFLKWSLDFFK